MKTYDESQIAAPLLTCVVCLQAWYATKPRTPYVCIECRSAAAKAAA